MEVKWTRQALNAFNNIRSKHFTYIETRKYKKELVKKIEKKINLLGTSIPADNPRWEGTYKLIVDKYVVYYSMSNNKKVCYIEYFKHFRENR